VRENVVRHSRLEQLENLDLAMTFVDNFGVAIDVGANIGEWAEKMALKFSRVIAFEPGEDVFEKLVKVGKFHNNIDCHKKAVGDVEYGQVELVSLQKKVRNSQSRYIRKIAHKNGEVFVNHTSMTTIDSLNLDKLDLLKIDVEGAEMLVLQGAAKTILKYKPVIIIEDSSYGKRYGYRQDATDKVLKKWGASEVAYRTPDKIFSFKGAQQ